MKKINRIFLFGDSFIEGQGVYDESKFDGTYRTIKEPSLNGHEKRLWRKKNSWEKYLRNYFPDVDFINLALQGSNNYNQFIEFNRRLYEFKEDDLVLFGFTSKYRDTPYSINYSFTESSSNETLLHRDNPISKNPLAWEKISIEEDFYLDGDALSYKFKNENEKKITNNFLKKFFINVFDEVVYENIAQVNYLFYQEFIKENPHLNIHFFDLFESYVDKNFVGNDYEVDKNIYLTYGEDDLHTFIAKHEKENGMIIDEVLSYWEVGNSYPIKYNKIFHPNQHGYKLWIDYMYDKWLSKKYK